MVSNRKVFQYSLFVLLGCAVFLAATVTASAVWLGPPTNSPTNVNNVNNNADAPIYISPLDSQGYGQAKNGPPLLGSLLDVNGIFSAGSIIAWNSFSVLTNLFIASPAFCPTANCTNPGLLSVWGRASILDFNPSNYQPLPVGYRSSVLIGKDASSIPKSVGLTIDLTGRHSNTTGAGRDGILLLSDNGEDHSNIITNKPTLGIWSSANNYWADAHFRNALFDQGSVTIDLSQLSGPAGANALNFIGTGIQGYSSNTPVGIKQNKSKISFFNYTSTDPGVTLKAKNVQLIDGTQGSNKILTSDDDGLSSWKTFGATDTLGGIKIVRKSEHYNVNHWGLFGWWSNGTVIAKAECPQGYYVLSGGGHCYGGVTQRVQSSEPGPGLQSDTTNGSLDDYTYWYVQCTNEGGTNSGNSGNATAYAICAPKNNELADVSVYTPPAVPCVISGFYASPTTVHYGNHGFLYWSTTGCTSRTLTSNTGLNLSNQPASASNFDITPTSTTTYTLTASGPNNTTSMTATVTVDQIPPPTPGCVINSFTATPSTVHQGETTTLTWTSSNCSGHATITPAVPTPQTYLWENGSTVTSQFSGSTASSTTYTITLSGSQGSSDSETVTVQYVPLNQSWHDVSPSIGVPAANPPEAGNGNWYGQTCAGWLDYNKTAAPNGSGIKSWNGGNSTLGALTTYTSSNQSFTDAFNSGYNGAQGPGTTVAGNCAYHLQTATTWNPITGFSGNGLGVPPLSTTCVFASSTYSNSNAIPVPSCSYQNNNYFGSTITYDIKTQVQY